MNLRHLLITGTTMACVLSSAKSGIDNNENIDSALPEPDPVNLMQIPDSLVIDRLTDDDYKHAAKELGIDVAAIKAVVQIEAGANLNGFHAPRVPLINFDLTMFMRAAKKRGINLVEARKTHPVVFSKPNIRRYGSYQEAQHARLTSAMSIDSIAAIEGTFWGMFQIGGFNWNKCGASSHFDFVERMSRSEAEQLNMFASFIKANKLDKYLKQKDWETFARIYNGPSYKKRNYHTRMAAAYKKFSK